VTLINTQGLTIIGPGSEWFWTAVSGVVLAVTFLAIYRQLSLARSANAFTQLNTLVEEWEGERLVRKRLAILVALYDGVAPEDIPDSPAGAVANYWEKVGSLARARHISPALIAEGLGGADGWWGILAPWVKRVRALEANPQLFEHFEWIAATLVRRHPALAFDQASFTRTLQDRIVRTEADLRDLESMRGATEPARQGARPAPAEPKPRPRELDAPALPPSGRSERNAGVPPSGDIAAR
jgi:hypothetical protein